MHVNKYVCIAPVYLISKASKHPNMFVAYYYATVFIWDGKRERDCRAHGATLRKGEQGPTEYQVCYLARGLQNFPAASAPTSLEWKRSTTCRRILLQLATDLAATMFLQKWLKWATGANATQTNNFAQMYNMNLTLLRDTSGRLRSPHSPHCCMAQATTGRERWKTE